MFNIASNLFLKTIKKI